MMKPGPFRLEPVCLAKIWARDVMAEPYGTLLNAAPGIGEVWLASDRLYPTPIAEGELAGLGLDEVVGRWPEWICGANAENGFPLLLKVLSVGEWLSVQVHPDDEAARRLENEPRGKSEAWHVLSAENGARIVHGVSAEVDQQRLRRALDNGSIIDLLEYVAVHAGQTFHVPAGTIHSIGPGLTLLEIQQSSDLTYRFYDWDRPGLDGKLRELHVDKALEVMKARGPGAPVEPQDEESPAVLRLATDPSFCLRRCSMTETYRNRSTRPSLLFFTEGSAQIMAEGYPTQRAQPGETWLIPAGVTTWSVEPAGQKSVFFESTPG